MIDDRCAYGVSIALFRAQKDPKIWGQRSTEKAYINRHASGAKSSVVAGVEPGLI